MTTSKFVTLTTLSVIFIFLTITTQAQVYLLNSETNGTTISTCSGTLYDSGGEMGSYQSNENYTITICSVDPNSNISLQFNEFTIENPFDFLFVYDGPSTSSPFISENSGSTLSGQSIISSGNCLTIKFTSDGSANYNGFAAEISCL